MRRPHSGTVIGLLVGVALLHSACHALVDSDSPLLHPRYQYTLLTPKSVISGEKLHATLTLYKSEACSPCTLSFQSTIRTAADDPNLYDSFKSPSDLATAGPPLAVQEHSLSSDDSSLDIVIDVESTWLDGQYELLLISEGGSFNVSAFFSVSLLDHTLIISTDKPVYKPSQTVRIRAVLFDPYMKPKNQSLTALIQDSAGNSLRRWRNVYPEDGIAQFELPLSDRPPLGTWKITIETGLVKKSVDIQVSEYVLPKFDVEVLVSSKTSTDSVKFSVLARYTYGEPVYGTLSVVVTLKDKQMLLEPKNQFEGQMPFELSADQLSDLGSPTAIGSNLIISASLTEPLSGITEETEAATKLIANNFQLEFMEINSRFFRPGHAYIAYYIVSHPDGSILGDSNLTLHVQLGRNLEQSLHYPVPQSGIVLIRFAVPVNVGQVSIQATVLNSTGTVLISDNPVDIIPFTSINSGNTLTVSRHDSSYLKAGEIINLEVSASQPNISISYVVLTGKLYRTSGSVKTGVNGTATISLPITGGFSPSISVLVHANVNGELLADSVHFNVFESFTNLLTIEMPSSDVKPGQAITAKVNTTSGSMVGLTSVDSSILLLGEPNDITPIKVMDELDDLVKSPGGCKGTEDDQEILELPRGFKYAMPDESENSGMLISKAGLTVVTTLSLEKCATLRNIGTWPIIATSGKEARVRKHFPETWIWSLQRTKSPTTVLNYTVPDTITTWVTTAVSMHPSQGLAVLQQPHQLTVVQPFFIVMHLPYNAVQTEEIEVKAVMYNYNDQDDICTVTLTSDEHNVYFALKYSENDVYGVKSLPVEERVSAGQGVQVTWWIKPLVIGDIIIHITAQCKSGQQDAMERKLPIKSHGVAKSYCWNNFLIMENNSYHQSVEILYPDNVVPGSKHVDVTATGNVLGSSLDSLDNLIRLPYGCGEQNMIVFAPSVYVRKYLETIDEVSDVIERKTTDYMLRGYQRQLSYRHDDSLFSAFGKKDPSGSTWLTAFVLKTLKQAQPYIDDSIDENTFLQMKEILLAYRRSSDGAFLEPGIVIHNEMQGGSFTSRSTLTAYIFIALVESADNRELMIEELAQTVSYLERVRQSISNEPYKLSIVSYALALAESDKLDLYISRLMQFNRTTSDGDIYWSNSTYAGPAVSDERGYKIPTIGPTDIEMTSYALLAFLAMDDKATARQIAQWIIKQRNAQGGFSSTQDTVIALQALTEFGASVIPEDMDVKVQFMPGVISQGSEGKMQNTHFNIDRMGFMITNKQSLDNAENIKSVTVDVQGKGTVMLSICINFNIADLEKLKTLTTMDIQKPETSDKNKLTEKQSISYTSLNETSVTEAESQVNVTVETKSGNDNTTQVNACARATKGVTGMSIISVEMPSGHEPVMDKVSSESLTHKLIERAEDNTVYGYFDNFTDNVDTCLTVPIKQTTNVNNIQEATVSGYEYYQPEKGDMATYSTKKSNPRIIDPAAGQQSDSTRHFICMQLIICCSLLIHSTLYHW